MKLLSIIVPVYNQEKLIVRALESIPKRDDIEILIVDDCSTDNTLKVISNFAYLNKELDIKIFSSPENRGCGYSKNFMYSKAIGKYIITLDSDDYFLPDFNRAIDYLTTSEANDYDLIFISNEINDGSIWNESDRAATWSYFATRKFLNDNNITYQLRRRAEDWYMMEKIKQLNPRIKLTSILSYHYNYPREGSIVWNYEHGIE